MGHERMNFADVHASRMLNANNGIRTTAGSDHLIILRKFVKPKPTEIDQTWKEVPLKQQIPYKEQTVLAKVRPLSDAELTSTEFGMIKQGDLFVAVDPTIEVLTFDQMRFQTDSLLDDGSTVSNTWDYTIEEVKRTDFATLKIAQTFIARRKVEQTPGGPQQT
jgi:hypothetical protein